MTLPPRYVPFKHQRCECPPSMVDKSGGGRGGLGISLWAHTFNGGLDKRVQSVPTQCTRGTVELTCIVWCCALVACTTDSFPLVEEWGCVPRLIAEWRRRECLRTRDQSGCNPIQHVGTPGHRHWLQRAVMLSIGRGDVHSGNPIMLVLPVVRVEWTAEYWPDTGILLLGGWHHHLPQALR
jgi:hypothetical protein